MKPSDILTSLVDIRKANNLSQEEVAANLGLNSQSGFSRMERGVHSPTLVTLTNWADVLGYELTLKKKGG